MITPIEWITIAIVIAAWVTMVRATHPKLEKSRKDRAKLSHSDQLKDNILLFAAALLLIAGTALYFVWSARHNLSGITDRVIGYPLILAMAVLLVWVGRKFLSKS